ncbi:C40 family peptidase [Gelidibacter maritimus]|uniref:C40 family peptidase n=1 Tax=Gelidibacter maritimus TaxID=2761487 RepID=A0A7W2M6A4_9FLAO|nr:C40 family peptidase [Gelidibacter maritimus]MBA6153467.1 C40 family peptidase [Gelidibacter maritimus]
MKKIVLCLLLFIAFSSCTSTKEIAMTTSKTRQPESNSLLCATKPILPVDVKSITLNPVDVAPISLNISSELPKSIHTKASRIVDYAFAFDGVKYKRGGTTLEGMDCSGLVVTTFNSENITLPRISRDMANTGSLIDLKEVSKGDLLFFATRKNSKSISHVGIVTTAADGFVEFIHASVNKGVIVSNMAEKYWHLTFVQARRVI